jgi:hypothetical protein
MPQSSTTTSLLITNEYSTASSIGLGGLVAELAAGNTAAGQTVSMSSLRYTLALTQQGSKLVGTGATSGTPTQVSQGYSVSLSADGNTLAIGGRNDNSFVGATWIFTRSGTTWTQQGSKLVGTGNVGGSLQGTSVSLSADGNTLAVGGSSDNTSIGATWIFTRSGTTWTQQGSKLVGTGATGAASQGSSVSLSADGNTLAVGGFGDNTNIGATWIWTRSGTTWTQQGSKLVGTGNTGASLQGISVSLSADGNTLAVGGYGDNVNVGAAWIWTRSGTTWTQQGSKLVGTGNTGASRQGFSISLSSSGNTLAVGAPNDNGSVGAIWIWTRSGTTWTQQGSKLVGTGTVFLNGTSVSLSADGNVLATGATNNAIGGMFIFTRTTTTWTQQGSYTTGTGNNGNSFQGQGISISKTGNTVALGGPQDQIILGGYRLGATWIFV